MRIALISNLFPAVGGGGVERIAQESTVELRERGHEVLTLGLGAGEGELGCELPGLEPVDPNEGRLAKIAWHLRDQWSLSVFNASRRALTRFSPDVALTHSVQGLSASVYDALSALDVPNVHTVQDYGDACMRASFQAGDQPCGTRCASCIPQRLIRLNAMHRSVTTLIAPSEFVRDRLLEAGVPRDKRLVLIRNGAHAPSSQTDRAHRGKGALTVGFIGALRPNKAPDIVISTARNRAADDRVSFVVAGAGPMEDMVRAEAETLPNLRFAGRVDGESKERFFEEIDVLMVPSQWDDPAPLVAVEAGLRGIPAIVSGRGGLPETVGATVVMSAEWQDFDDALEALMDPDRLSEARAKLAAAGDRLSWSGQIDATERELEAVARPR